MATVDTGVDVSTDTEVIRPSAGGVLAIGLGLLVVLIAALSLVRKNDTSLDGAALVDEWFGLDGALPLGLEVRAANRLALGEEVVQLGLGSSADAVPAPTEIFFVRYPLGRANEEIAKLFEEGVQGFGQQGGGRDEEQHGGGPEEDGFRDWGQLDWFDYRAPYVLVRKRPQGGGPFTDSIRVNLSQPGFACVLIASWDPDVEGGKAFASELLTQLEPRF